MRFLLVRHAEATGQEQDAPLTDYGSNQAKELCEFISKFFKIDRIMSSPFDRAIKTIKPLADHLNLAIETDDRLKECYLRGEVPDEEAEEESSGLQRALAVVNDVVGAETFTVLVAHGNMILILLKWFSENMDDLMLNNISRPDLFMITFAEDNVSIVDHLYTEGGPLQIIPRPSARSILLNANRSAIFLFQLEDEQMASRSSTQRLWITPGGGVDPGEELSSALQRELFEELSLGPGDFQILGHLWTSHKTMIWKGKPHMFIDNYFVVQLCDHADETFNFVNQTDDERKVLKQFKWFPFSSLPSFSDRIVPDQIKELGAIDFSDLPAAYVIEENV